MPIVAKKINELDAVTTTVEADLIPITNPTTGVTKKSTITKFLADIFSNFLRSGVATTADVLTSLDKRYVTDAQLTQITNSEVTTNKVTSLSGTSTDVQYPSAKVTYDSLELKTTVFPGICMETPIEADDISINYTTRVLTIIPPLGYFHFFTDGGGVSAKHTKTGNVNFPAFTDTSGIWYFYFDAFGAPISTQNPWSNFNIIAPVYRLQWNATLTPDSAKSVIEGFECHLNDVSASEHEWMHRYGTIWASGLETFNNVLAVGNPNADGRNTVIALNTGKLIDDNLPYTITNGTGADLWMQDLGNITPASLNATNSALFKIRNRVAGLNYLLPATRFPFKWNTGSNRPEYIDINGTATLVANNNFFVNFIYGFSDPRNGFQVKIVSATAEFTTLANAQAFNWANIQTAYTDLRDNEIRPLYKLIHEYKSTFDVGCKYSVLRQVDDIRKAQITQATSTAGTLPASSITYVAGGNIISTNVQSAIEEIDSERATFATTITSTVATGTAPLNVASTTKVTNLNADSVDGYDFNQALLTSSSPTFATALLTNLTDGYVPYHVSDASGLANSVIFQSGTNIGFGTTQSTERINLNANILIFGGSINNANSNGIIFSTNDLSYNAQIKTKRGAAASLIGLAFVTTNGTTPTEKMTLLPDGSLGIGTTAPSEKFEVTGNIKCSIGIFSDRIRLTTAKTPASATDTGTAGDFASDSNYLYSCVATNTWKRVALSTW